MRKRLLLSLGWLAFAFLAFVALFWWTLPTNGVTWDNYFKISEGMSKAEVEHILGRPPDAVEDNDTGEAVERKARWIGTWQSKTVLIWVWFGENDSVFSLVAVPNELEDSFHDKLRRWLGLPWW